MELSIPDLLHILVSGAAVVPITNLLQQLVGKDLSKARTRLLAFSLCAILGVGAWAALIGLGYTPAPVDIEAGAKAVIAIVLSIYGTSQGVYGLTKREPS